MIVAFVCVFSLHNREMVNLKGSISNKNFCFSNNYLVYRDY